MTDAGPPTGGPNASIRPHAGPSPYAGSDRFAGANVPPPPAQTRSRRRGVPFVLVVVLVGVALAAAGYALVRAQHSDTPGEAATSFVKAASAGNVRKTCDLLARSNKKEFADQGTTCEEDFAQLLGQQDQPGSAGSAGSAAGMFAATPDGRIPKVHILEERVHGDRAEVVIRIGDEATGADGPVVMVREEGSWKVDLRGEPSTDPARRTCRTEKQVVDLAVEAYQAHEGKPPANAQTLVDAGMLESLPRHSKVGSDGTITMTGDCA